MERWGVFRIKKLGIIFQNSYDQIIVTSIYKNSFMRCFFNGFFSVCFQWFFQCFFQWFFQCLFSMDFSVVFSIVFPVVFHLFFQWFYFIRSTLKVQLRQHSSDFPLVFPMVLLHTFYVKRYNFVNTPKKY